MAEAIECRSPAEIEDDFRILILDEFVDVIPDQDTEFQYLLSLDHDGLLWRWHHWVRMDELKHLEEVRRRFM